MLQIVKDFIYSITMKVKEYLNSRIMVLLIFVLLVLASLIAMSQSFLYGLLFLVCGSISLVMSTFFIYLFIDMRESLLKIVDAQPGGVAQVTAVKEAEKAE